VNGRRDSEEAGSGMSMTNRSSVQELLPADKGDVGRARSLVELGYPGVREVLPEILEWLQDGNWPVFPVLAPFVASLGRVIVPHVKHVLSTNDEVWKYWVLSRVVRSAPPEVVDDIRSGVGANQRQAHRRRSRRGAR
jgi:hypothetical protein